MQGFGLMTGAAPSIVPGVDQETYLVLDDFGPMGQAWRETDPNQANLESVIADLFDDQYSNPVRVIAFNTAEGWSRDVSDDVARELRQRCADQDRELPTHLKDFVERHDRERADRAEQTRRS
jgi:hypothetical protein